MDLKRSVNGAIAGGVAAAVWAAQQPADKRAFGSAYDDVELLGKLVTRGDAWPAAGLAVHLANGATFGATYAQLRPFLPGPLVVRAATMAMAEHLALYPLGRVSDRFHPARKELAPLWGNRRAFAQATWRHLLFGLVLGEIERRLNVEGADEPPEVPVSSNGHGNIEVAVGTA
ncbi:MAG: hypothetical protein H0U25_07420 [Thermoleophilaceae bacterium]|nr:hypothetical protein [Thermoleophilaceae bacterium]